MSEKTTILPSLRNQEWIVLKVKNRKKTKNKKQKTKNEFLTFISTNNITESNELFYAGAKLVCDKIGVPP